MRTIVVWLAMGTAAICGLMAGAAVLETAESEGADPMVAHLAGIVAMLFVGWLVLCLWAPLLNRLEK